MFDVRLDQGDRDKARQLRTEGWSLAAIANLIGCHPTTIYRLVGRNVGPDVTTISLDGRAHPGRRDLPARACRWCGNPTTNPQRDCSRRCTNQRRRYRQYLATGRIPQQRARRDED